MSEGPKSASNLDERFMRLALEQAAVAGMQGEVPIGAVLVVDGKVVGAGGNRTRRDSIVHAHAELVALSEAQQQAGDFRLDGATMYVTVEPCLMCLGALLQSRLRRIVYGAPEPKFGALESRFALAGHPALEKVEVQGGVLAQEAALMLSEFFRRLRQGA